MRLIISQFLRTLRERDEFDRLLPELLLSMGYVPQSKPQTGVRQYGVDLVAIGPSPEDGVDEMLLLVIKQGDLGRRDWDNGEPTSVRPSLNEVLDAYLTKLVATENAGLRKTVVLATTGDLKQDVETNWTGFKEANSSRASFDFWGADRVADLIERYMLDENLFDPADRSDLRKALALAGNADYDFRDLNRLLLRQLGLNRDGKVAQPEQPLKHVHKALRRVHLASLICSRWAQADGDTRQALWVSERAILWSWHRVQQADAKDQAQLAREMAGFFRSYMDAAAAYFQAVSPHLRVRDGLAGYGESAGFAVVLFEHIGFLGAIGLACFVTPAHDGQAGNSNVSAIADGLCALISNHGASASPRLDEHIIDVTLALLFLTLAGRDAAAKQWIEEIARRMDFCYGIKSKFPVATDSLEDLVDLEVNQKDQKLVEKLMSTSWSLATIAAWCAIFELEEHYAALSRGLQDKYSQVCAQLWHPTSGWAEGWYFERSLDQGASEAPYILLPSLGEMRRRMRDFLLQPDYEWMGNSKARPIGLWALDFIACRHFRMPVPASCWYQLLPNDSGGLIEEESLR